MKKAVLKYFHRLTAMFGIYIFEFQAPPLNKLPNIDEKTDITELNIANFDVKSK